MLKDIQGTEVKINTDFINKEILADKLRQVEAAYIESITWLEGVNKIIAHNDPEKDKNNLDQVLKQKDNVEKSVPDLVSKMEFIKSLL